MFLSVKEMELRRVSFDETLPPGELDFSAESLVQGSPLHASGVAELMEDTGGELRIQGRFTVEMDAECDRCLGPARFALDQAFDLFYRPAADLTSDEDVQIDPAAAEMGFYENGGLELAEILREQILLALPMQRVCREDCKGICPQCGQNRNQAGCHCATASVNDRWGSLRNLK